MPVGGFYADSSLKTAAFCSHRSAELQPPSWGKTLLKAELKNLGLHELSRPAIVSIYL